LKVRSLRWRIANFYALLLLGVIAIVTVVLIVQLRTILLDEARAKIDRVGTDIASVVRGTSVLNSLGENGLPIEDELTTTGYLDHWSGPTTFVEIDTPAGYTQGKSTNMGGASFARTVAFRSQLVIYRVEDRPLLGSVLVRDELFRYPGVNLIVQVGESLAIYDETLQRIRNLLAIVLVLAAVVVVTGSFAIASSAIEPIKRLNAAMGEISSDRLSARLGWSDRRDELGSLAQSFDAMLDRLEDGFARERQFISDASHELKTPLTVINANAQMLERWADRDSQIRADSLRAIREESASLAAMVNGMLLLAKAESGDDLPREPVDLEHVVVEAVRIAQPRADEKGLEVTLHSDPNARVLGDANLLRQLVTNLLDNAIKFTDSGSIDVTVERSGDRSVVTVRDTGVGLDEESLERAFDRFFRADASRNRAVPGTGLGLAIVRSIARVHDGVVTASPRPGGGTAFALSLPTFTTLS
jgi:heavy metal sensor kinase